MFRSSSRSVVFWFFAAMASLWSGPLQRAILAAEELDTTRFERTVVCGDLVQPMELDVAADGRIFLIELAGVLKTIDPLSGRQEVVGKLNVTTAQENGLIGLALDPKFKENGWIYLQYSPPDFPGQHVSRFDFRDNRLVLESEKVLFRYEEQRRECCHHAGSLEFGPDGNLYIGTGDNTNPFNDSQGYAPLDERGDREPWDAQRTAGNTRSYNGKILRIHPEADGTYSIPDGNLFPKDKSLGHPEIYVMGCRNPWRIQVDPKTGYLYWGDVGPDAGHDNQRGPRGYDEFNQARSAGNYGWPYFIGNNFAYSLVNFATGEIGSPQDPAHPLNRSRNNTGATELPPARPAMVFYPSATSTDFPMLESGGRTACAGPVYYFDPKAKLTTRFPEQYDRTFFAYEWSRSAIYAIHLDQQSNVERIERFLPDMKFVRPVDMVFDASGALLVIEYGETWGVNRDARLVRLDYIRGNRKPVAVAQAKNDVGREPLTVELSAAGSSDKDGDPLEFQWSSIRAGVPNAQRQILSQKQQFQIEFDTPGVYTIELQAKDAEGATDVTSLPVIVGNARPQVEFVTPRDGDFFVPGENVRFRVVVRDKEDGTSDIEQAEEDGWHFIEAMAPNRLFIESVPVPSAAEASAQETSPGLALIRKSDCFNCHTNNRPLVGPSFVDIANKYRDQPHQLDQSVARVLNGSTGVWGKVGMLPHQQHTPAEVRSMVEYVYSVTAASSNPIANGFNNVIATQPTSGSIRLEATYTDLGRDDIPKLIGVGAVTLRNPHLQAEEADAIAGAKRLNSDNAEGKQFVGAIEHDGYLQFSKVRFDDLSAIKVRVASAGAGGTIEIHRGSVDGPLLGQTSVEVNGQWEKFYDKTFPLEQGQGQDDLFVVFKNFEKRGGLMNIDSLQCVIGDPVTGGQ
jgi:cytochrome c